MDNRENSGLFRARLVQSGLAGLYILLAFFCMDRFQSNLAVASLGASTFIVFAFPKTQSSRSRVLVGGYCVGMIWGILARALILFLEAREDALLVLSPYSIGCGLAMFFCMLTMSLLQVEHPPSAALTMAVATSTTPVELGFAAVGFVCLLCLIRRLLGRWLINLS